MRTVKQPNTDEFYDAEMRVLAAANVHGRLSSVELMGRVIMPPERGVAKKWVVSVVRLYLAHGDIGSLVLVHPEFITGKCGVNYEDGTTQVARFVAQANEWATN